MLTFEVIQPAKDKAIQICCDEAGINLLIDAISRLQEQGHVHLRAPSAGGKDILDITGHGKKAISEVIITFISE